MQLVVEKHVHNLNESYCAVLSFDDFFYYTLYYTRKILDLWSMYVDEHRIVNFLSVFKWRYYSAVFT